MKTDNSNTPRNDDMLWTERGDDYDFDALMKRTELLLIQSKRLLAETQQRLEG